jgi:hypothetical protein
VALLDSVFGPKVTEFSHNGHIVRIEEPRWGLGPSRAAYIDDMPMYYAGDEYGIRFST